MSEQKVTCIWIGDRECKHCRHDLPRYRPMSPLPPIIQAPKERA